VLRVDGTRAVALRAENEKAEKLTDRFFDHSLEGGRVIGIAAMDSRCDSGSQSCGLNDLDSREGNDWTGKCRAQLDSVDNLGKGGRFVKRSIKECLGDGRSGNLVPIDIRFCNGSRCNQGTLTDSHLSSSRADVTNVGSRDDGRHDGLSLDRISTDLLLEISKDFERTNEKGCSLIGCKNDIESMNGNRATRQLNSVPCRASVVAEIHTDNSRCGHVHSDTNDVDNHRDKGQYVSMTKDSRSKLFPVQKSRNNEDREQMFNDHRNKHVSWSRTERSEVDDSNSDIELSKPSTRMHFTAKAASKYKVSAGGYVDGQGSSGRGELGSIGRCTNDRVKLSGSESDNCCRGSRHADCRLSAQSIDNRQKVDIGFLALKSMISWIRMMNVPLPIRTNLTKLMRMVYLNET
jgi:hypothetical protein